MRECLGHAVSGLADGNNCEIGELGEVVAVGTRVENPVVAAKTLCEGPGDTAFRQRVVEDLSGALTHDNNKRIVERQRRVQRHAARLYAPAKASVVDAGAQLFVQPTFHGHAHFVQVAFEKMVARHKHQFLGLCSVGDDRLQRLMGPELVVIAAEK
jgi:hypothetical protein